VTRDALGHLMREVFEQEIMALREAGQKEYAHDVDNAFANFERAAEDLGLDRKMVLWVFAMKHRDGIASFLQGHRSQRENVRGRINDLIVYLLILRGMIEEEEGVPPRAPTATRKGPAPRPRHRTGSGQESRGRR
jgi:hypothetical protein